MRQVRWWLLRRRIDKALAEAGWPKDVRRVVNSHAREYVKGRRADRF